MRPVPRSLILIAGAAIALSACSKAAEPADAPAAAAAAPTETAARIGDFDLGQPIRALGTEPFWTVDVANGTVTWKDESDAIGDVTTPRTGPAGTPAITGDTAVYTTTLSDGRPLVLTLKAEACPDIGEQTRALTASVKIGDTTHEACADARTAYPEDSVSS